MTSKMTINKYQGKTKEEAIEKAKQELGEGAVVMNVKEIKPTGMFKVWKSSVFEVTAAREEKENFVDPRQVADLTAKTVKTLNLAADENISPKEFLNDRTSDILSGHLTNAPELHAKDGLEKRLENLSNILEKQLSVEESRQKEVKEEEKERQVVNPEGLQFIKMLYRTLLENEVNEKYVNQILDEAEMREPVLSSLLDAIQLHLDRRAAGAFRVGAVLFSNQYGPLGQTRTAKELLDEWKNG